MTRDIDWNGYLNNLVYCFGCGRFGVNRKGKNPRGWTVLYQPHGDGPAGLHVCGAACADKVREAMETGPVLEPLNMGPPPMMPVDVRSEMEMDVLEGIKEEAMEKKKLGPYVKSLRMRDGMSKTDIEVKTRTVERGKSIEGIPPMFLTDVEEGRRPLNAAQCLALSTLFNTDVDELIELSQEFHHGFWSAQGVQPEVETKIGRTVPTPAEVAKLRDEIARLRSDLTDGLTIMSDMIKDSMSGSSDSEEPAIAWTKRAMASLDRTNAVVGASTS